MAKMISMIKTFDRIIIIIIVGTNNIILKTKTIIESMIFKAGRVTYFFLDSLKLIYNTEKFMLSFKLKITNFFHIKLKTRYIPILLKLKNNIIN